MTNTQDSLVLQGRPQGSESKQTVSDLRCLTGEVLFIRRRTAGTRGLPVQPGLLEPRQHPSPLTLGLHSLHRRRQSGLIRLFLFYMRSGVYCGRSLGLHSNNRSWLQKHTCNWDVLHGLFFWISEFCYGKCVVSEMRIQRRGTEHTKTLAHILENWVLVVPVCSTLAKLGTRSLCTWRWLMTWQSHPNKP